MKPTLKPKRSLEETAACRSPNRKPRYRMGWHKARIKTLKEAVVAQAVVGKTVEQITVLLGLMPTAIYDFRKDTDFARRHDQAIEAYRQAARGQLAGKLLRAIEVINDTMEGTNESELRFKAAHAIAKGMGVTVEKQEQEVKGLIGIFSADDLAREYRTGKKKLAEGSERPVEVFNGAGQDK